MSECERGLTLSWFLQHFTDEIQGEARRGSLCLDPCLGRVAEFLSFFRITGKFEEFGDNLIRSFAWLGRSPSEHLRAGFLKILIIGSDYQGNP